MPICSKSNHTMLIKTLRPGENIWCEDGISHSVLRIYTKTEYANEWSVHFEWTDLNSTRVVNPFWADAWFDFQTNEIHCCVRRFNSDMCIKAPATKTLKKFAKMLETSPWDDWVVDANAYNDFETSRAASRAYNARLALSMGLHPRLGKGSGIACLGEDILRLIV